MRFEEPVIDLVARFPELRVHRSRQIAPYVTLKEIAEGVARGRRLRGIFCRRVANAILVMPALAATRFVTRIVVAARIKLKQDRIYRSTVDALGRLDDHQLHDIGVARSDILRVARKVVYAQQLKASGRTLPVEHSSKEVEFEDARAA